MFESVDGRKDARTDARLESHTISSPWAFGYDELKKIIGLDKHIFDCTIVNIFLTITFYIPLFLWALKRTVSLRRFF